MLFNECFKPSVETAQGKTMFCFVLFQNLPAHWQCTDHPRTPMQIYKEAKDVSVWTNDSSPALSLRLWLPATFKPYYLITAFYKVITNTEMKTSGGLAKS